MRLEVTSTDDAVLAEIGARLQRTRLERNQTQQQLADEAGIGVRTLERLESGRGATLGNVVRVLRALDLLDAFDRALPPPLASPVERLKLAGRRRRRASGMLTPPRAADRDDPTWTWGDEEQP